MAGIDEFVASTRINRYEQGVHRADFVITKNIADCLNAPMSYFYTEDEQFAEIQLTYHRTSVKKKKEINKFVINLCMPVSEKV